ncbi:MAG TPA: DNA translocase FtsK 4TM domain-containing protein, partial [Burkholderiales bacterium]|nr:DNA translocase FtsK 4TM domain-containing protein [Burkholderiales bacterium]
MRPASKGGTPLPARLAGLLREARWLLLIAAGLYLLLVFATFQRSDPGWSHSATDAVARNGGGAFGAWLADLLLYLFGVSAYWWVALCAYIVVWGYRRLDGVRLAAALGGFALLIGSSAALERLRMHSLAVELPLAPGGLIGEALGVPLAGVLGLTGATLALLTFTAIGFSLFIGVSWLTIFEVVGTGLEKAYVGAFVAWDRRRDRKLGSRAREEREAQVEIEKRREVEHPPLRIEPALAEIKKSERVQKERQAPLFEHLPDTPLPPLKLLDEAAGGGETIAAETLEFTSRLIEKKLSDFGVAVKVLAAYPGPVITRYDIEPAVGVKGSQIVNLVKDLARALSVVSIRVVETIPGKSCMGLEIPNPHRQTVRLSEILGSEAYHALHSPLALALGKDIAGHPVVADLARMPHLLVAGTTGSGKSVALNAMILSLLYKSELRSVRLILIDPKMLELSVYQDIPHLLAPVVTDMKQATNALGWCVAEMDRRYKLMNWIGARNLSGYNHKVAERKIEDPFAQKPDEPQAKPEILQPLPHIVVVIDQLADLMMVVGKKVEELIARLAGKARAAGIHLVLATQRPSVDVITGLIKANIPSRIAFQVSSKVDSRTILDQSGAETLLGAGDMLYLPPGTGLPQRVHGAFVADHEVHKVVEYLKSLAQPDYVGEVLEPAEQEEIALDGVSSGEKDPLYDQAVEIVLRTRRPSISLVQRHLRIGYNRAARLI